MGLYPRIDERMVMMLAAQFPDQAPTLDQTEKEVWFRAGQVSVVRWLASRLEEQEAGLPFVEEGF